MKIKIKRDIPIITKGYFKTKEEVVRTGVLDLGKEYAIIGKPSILQETIKQDDTEEKINC